MVFFNHKLLNVAFLLVISFFGYSVSLYAADHDGNMNILERLTYVIKDGRFGNKTVTYYAKTGDAETQVGFIRYGSDGSHYNMGTIDRIEIKSEYRKYGIGSYILQQAIQDLKAAGYQEVRLEAIPFDTPMCERKVVLKKLVAFYKKNGFEIVKKHQLRPTMRIVFSANDVAKLA